MKKVPNLQNRNSKRKAASKAFWSVANLYHLTRDEQAKILDIKPNRDRLKKLEDSCELPDGDDVLLRIGILTGIHKNLRILFPYNREVVYKWLKISNPDFEGHSPIDYLMQGTEGESLNRLASIRRRLDQIRCGGH